MRNFLTLLLLLLTSCVTATEPIRKVTFEFRLPQAQYPWARWGTGERVICNDVYFKGPLTNAKLIAFLKSHPQGGPAQQAQGYANKLSQDLPEHLLEVYLAKLDAGEDWTAKLTDKISEENYQTYWYGGKGAICRHFYLWISPTENAWVRMEISSVPTGD